MAAAAAAVPTAVVQKYGSKLYNALWCQGPYHPVLVLQKRYKELNSCSVKAKS